MNNKLLFSETPSKASHINGFQGQCHNSFGRERTWSSKDGIVLFPTHFTRIYNTSEASIIHK